MRWSHIDLSITNIELILSNNYKLIRFLLEALKNFPLKLFFIFSQSWPYPYPGKNMRRDPAIPTWDPRCIPGGIPPSSGGIPTGILEHPRWDPDRDYGTSQVGSHPGLWNIPCGIPPRVMERPTWDSPQIPLGIPPGKSYWRRDCTWDPANPSLDSA